MTTVVLHSHGRLMNQLKLAEKFWKKKIIRKNLRWIMLKIINTVEPKLKRKTTKIKRTKDKAQM